MDARAFASPKGLRPRRRVKPAYDPRGRLTVAQTCAGEAAIAYLQPTAETLSLSPRRWRGCGKSRRCWGPNVSDPQSAVPPDSALSSSPQRWMTPVRSRWLGIVLLVAVLFGGF